MTEEQRQNARQRDNVIFVGKKPTMSYVLAVMTQFSEGTNDVQIKARGRSISVAVDVAEAVKNKFMKDLKNAVEIGTEEIIDERKNKLNISTITISLTK